MPGCDDGGSGGPSGASLETLGGSLVDIDRNPIAGARLEFGGGTVTSDSSGRFLLPTPGILATGTYPLTVIGPGDFGTLQVPVDVQAGSTDIELPRPLTLADLVAFPAGGGTVAVDANGASLDPISLAGALGDLELAGPAGTAIRIAGAPAVGAVELAIAPLAGDQLTPPLPADLVAVGAAAIAPESAEFLTPDGAGLDLLLPDAEALPLGTAVELYRFDTASLAWSRVEGAGAQVVELPGGARAVAAPGAVRTAGLWAATLPLDSACGTTLAGRVIDGAGAPLEGFAVTASTGASTLTAADGGFVLPDVAAYELSSGSCAPTEVRLLLDGPLSAGGLTVGPIAVGAGQLVPGGVTELGDLTGAQASVGCVAGVVLGHDPQSPPAVQLAGPTPAALTADPSGTFFACGLAPGPYTASTTFPGDSAPTVVAFDVPEAGIAKIELERVLGGGEGDLEVRVLQRVPGQLDSTAGVAGARVFVRGSDPVSAQGLFATSDATGLARFQSVDGPFEITAIAEDLLSNSLVLRRATTLADVQAADGSATVLLDLEGEALLHPVAASARLSGGLANLPPGSTVELRVRGRELLGSVPLFSATTSAPLGAYAFDVPAGVPLDLTATVDSGSGASGLLGLELSLPPLGVDEQRLLDLDVAGFEPLDSGTPLTVTGFAASGVALVDAQLQADGAAGGPRVTATLAAGDAPDLGGTLDLPCADVAGLSGLARRLHYRALADGPFSTERVAQTATVALPDAPPTSLQLDLLALPSASAPAPTSSPAGVQLSLGSPAPAPSEGGFDRLCLEGFGFQFEGGPENAIVRWTLLLPAGTTEVTLPPVADEILQPTTYEGRWTAERFAGVDLSVADLSGAAAASSLSQARSAAGLVRTSAVEFDWAIQ